MLPGHNTLPIGTEPLLNTTNFLLLSLSTVLIAAAGYIINDYFDIRIDLKNKPEKVVVGKVISSRTSIIAHTVLNVAALLMAGYVAMQAHHYEWPLLQVGCTLLLWIYSTTLKRRYIIGNIAISLLTALTIVTLMAYEPTLQEHESGSIPGSLPVWVLSVYAYFAFMLTWIREIVKDMEDMDGDESEGCDTLPIRKGLQFATLFTMGLSLLVMLPLIAATFYLFRFGFNLLGYYIIVALVVPMVIWCMYIGRGFTARHYAKASRGLKVIMLLGILSLLLYYYQSSL